MNLNIKQKFDSILGYTLIALNLLPAKILGFFLRRNHKITHAPNRIVFIKLLGLGSIFMALDSIQSIKNKYPAAKLILITSKNIKPGTIPLGIFDGVLAIDDKNIFTLISTAFQTLLNLWKYKNTWIVDLEVYSKLSTIFSLWTLARNRFGFYLNSVWFRFDLNTHNIYFNEFVIVEENYKSMAEALGCTSHQDFQYPLPQNITINKNYIAINNTCSELGKERLAEDVLIAETMDWLIAHTSYQIALLGAPVDFKNNESFLNKYENLKSNPRIHNIAGKFSFNDYYNFLYAQCLLLVTVDTGPLHFARKLNVPTISLWGPTNPMTRIQEDSKNKLIYTHFKCSPCVHMVDVLPCNGDNQCMKQIKSTAIINYLQEMLPIQTTK